MATHRYNRTTSYYFGGLSKVGYLTIAAGLFVGASPLFVEDDNSVAKAVLVGTAFAGIGALLSFTRKGVLFDFAGKRYKEYTAVTGIKIGQWEVMPPFDRIAVRQGTYRYQTTSNGISPSFNVSNTLYYVSLYAGNPDPNVVLTTASRKEALKDLKILTDHFHLLVENDIPV